MVISKTRVRVGDEGIGMVHPVYAHRAEYTFPGVFKPFTDGFETLNYGGRNDAVSIWTNVQKVVAVLGNDIDERSDEVFGAPVVFVLRIAVITIG